MTAKPLTGPEARKNITMAEMNVVTLASMIADIASLKPSSMALIQRCPQFSRGCVQDDDVGIDAVPTVSTVPAMPGKVSVAPIVDA